MFIKIKDRIDSILFYKTHEPRFHNPMRFSFWKFMCYSYFSISSLIAFNPVSNVRVCPDEAENKSTFYYLWLWIFQDLATCLSTSSLDLNHPHSPPVSRSVSIVNFSWIKTSHFPILHKEIINLKAGRRPLVRYQARSVILRILSFTFILINSHQKCVHHHPAFLFLFRWRNLIGF